MLRLSSQTFYYFLKNTQKSSSLSHRVESLLQNKYFFTTAKIKAQFTDKLQSGKYYEVLGFTKVIDLDNLTDNQVKRQYFAMVKKYHSDGVIDPAEKIQNQEITKCIISAFEIISSDRIKTKISKGIYDKIYKDEDEIAMKIYGKKFDQIKYELFREGNEAKRTEFIEQLERIRKQSKFYDATNNQNDLYINRRNKRPLNIKFSSNDYVNLKYLIPFGTLALFLLLYFQKQSQQKAKNENVQKGKSKMTFSSQKIRQIQSKTIKQYQKKLSDLIDSFVQEQPPSLKYPSQNDPDQMDQLLDYTIGTDINLYEVSSRLMSKEQNLKKLKHVKSQQELIQCFGKEYRPFQLNKIKVNSYISLSLQAERCLQNIYIRVKDVAEQIQQTGKYTPPKIFFRFYGYLMFELREKPLSLQNYRNTEYVSLFDLFFDYYSPIPLKRHEYNEYLVGLNDEDIKMFGQVHLNHRKLSQRYISKQDKIVVMKDLVTMGEFHYTQIWHSFYEKYMRLWKHQKPDRISSEQE